jgi:pimeloyl-ACP methyl ester carboxylesterase
MRRCAAADSEQTMRERNDQKLERGLYIQIPGLISGGFLSHIPVQGDEDQQLPPHDLPTRRVSVGGAELHCFEFGDGHPVVFVHGSFSDYRAWLYQLEPFCQHYRYVSYSRRYHYPNEWQDDGGHACVRMHGEDLAQLIGRLELGRATLVGQSLAATVALDTAIAHPELVHSLVLSEPFIYPWLAKLPGGPEAWSPRALELRLLSDQRFVLVPATGWDPAQRNDRGLKHHSPR